MERNLNKKKIENIEHVYKMWKNNFLDSKVAMMQIGDVLDWKISNIVSKKRQ